MPLETPSSPLSVELLKSRFDNAHLVRVNEDAGIIAVWNGSQMINLYTFTLDEVEEGPHSVPKDDDGVPASREEVNDFIDEIFTEYAEGL